MVVRTGTVAENEALTSPHRRSRNPAFSLMILHFPDQETLRLALTAGEIPEEMAGSSIEFSTDDDGILISTNGSLAENAKRRLRKLGVSVKRSGSCSETARTWYELVPAGVDATTLPGSESNGQAQRIPILFELRDPERLPELVGEMLRLGNDRQSFRHIDLPEESALVTDSQPRTLLRVVGPPYYTLLRAIEGGGEPDEPRAFREQAQRVWVELGYAHPFAENLTPPAGQILLITADGEWNVVQEGRFRDVYDVLEFHLPGDIDSYAGTELPTKLNVPLSLSRATSSAEAELWVIERESLRQLDDLVSSSPDRLLDRLSFAVVEEDDRRDNPRIILRVRPGREAPPVLVLNANAYAPYLKLPNLFLPIGQRIHPPLRRDRLKSLLASDLGQLTWLEAEDASGFVAQSVPDSAFRPLSDWVEYVLDRDRETLGVWMQAFEFEFDDFICPEEEEQRRKKQTEKPERKKSGSRSGRSSEKRRTAVSKAAKEFLEKKDSRKKKSDTAEAIEEIPLEEVSPSELQVRLRELEEEFLAVDQPPRSVERRDAWREMAGLNHALGQSTDATVCWANVLWEEETLSADELWSWYVQEWDRVDETPPNEVEFDRALDRNRTGSPLLPGLIAYLAFVAETGKVPEWLSERLSNVQSALEEQERMLPIRVAWIGWRAIFLLSGRDELTLARARDRILERLYQSGISPDRELPSFLRASSMGTGGDRFRAVREQILGLHDQVLSWRSSIAGQPTSVDHHFTQPATKDDPAEIWTPLYFDLIFSYAYARLGENETSEALLANATDRMAVEENGKKKRGKRASNLVHDWVRRAYAFRIKEALNQKPPAGQLPQELIDRRNEIERDRGKEAAYRIDNLRNWSDILEPHEKISAYRRFQTSSNPLVVELNKLSDINDREELSSRLTTLWDRHRGGASDDNRALLLKTGLELSPRIGESIATAFLRETNRHFGETTTASPGVIQLFERALHISAHFGQTEDAQRFVRRIESIFADLRENELKPGATRKSRSEQRVDHFAKMLGQSVRGLRKLGLRDQMAQLLDHVNTAIDESYAKSSEDGLPDQPEVLELLLTVASGWFYFGQGERSWPIMHKVRRLLSEHLDVGPRDSVRIRLACSYIKAVSMAPVDEAVTALENLFQPVTEGGMVRITDHGTAADHYRTSQVRVAEAIALALVSEDFSLDRKGRRWLDDDEFRIRRRIHNDVRTAGTS